jgi:hypothetical protein
MNEEPAFVIINDGKRLEIYADGSFVDAGFFDTTKSLIVINKIPQLIAKAELKVLNGYLSPK